MWGATRLSNYVVWYHTQDTQFAWPTVWETRWGGGEGWSGVLRVPVAIYTVYKVQKARFRFLVRACDCRARYYDCCVGPRPNRLYLYPRKATAISAVMQLNRLLAPKRS